VRKKMKLHIPTLIALSIIFILNCSGGREPMEIKLINEKNSNVVLNRGEAKYYKLVGERKLQLHIFYPEGYDSTRSELYPAALNFHGGGWTEGIIEWGYSEAQYLSTQGMIGIAVEYRLADSETSVIETMKDANSALRWVRTYAQSFNIDSNRILAIGHSAGGHLSISTAMFPHFKEDSEDGGISSIPQMVWSYAPPVELTKDTYFRNLLMGKESVENCSPLSNIGKFPVSFNIITGVMDNVIPIDTVRDFVEAMKSEGNDIQLWENAKGDHMFFFDGGEGRKMTHELLRASLIEAGWILED
jgi:acetyl esterase/lipase